MTFAQAVRACLTRYFRFSGRARRSEYWWFVLFVFVGSGAFGLFDLVVFGTDPDSGKPRSALSAAFQVATLVPSLAVGWRRMHDTGRPGWHLLLPLAISLAGVGFVVLTDRWTAGTPGTGAAGAVVFWIAFVVTVGLTIWWLTRPTQPAANDYGPIPD